MQVAFYAPLKAPDHPVPSGDRTMARGLLDLLAAAGHQASVACRLRSFDRHGDASRQGRLAALGARMATAILRRIVAGRIKRPDVWLTYHPYYKSPDHVGPAIAERLNLAYVVAEPSLAAKRAAGPWSIGHASTLQALARADLVLALTERDATGLRPAVAPQTPLRLLRPFVDAGRFASARSPDTAAAPILLTVAMMREDVKEQSYAVLCAALSRCLDLPWRLVIAGDGPARARVQADYARLPPERVTFQGAVSEDQLPALYAGADLFVWPALDEAYGLALLEAQASGLPVIAGTEGGVPEIVRDGATGVLTDGRDPAAIAAAVRSLLGDPYRRRMMGAAARNHVLERHDRGHAASVLDAALVEACAHARQRRPGR